MTYTIQKHLSPGKKFNCACFLHRVVRIIEEKPDYNLAEVEALSPIPGAAGQLNSVTNAIPPLYYAGKKIMDGLPKGHPIQ